MAVAKTLLEAPYLIGGITKNGIDCSGFTQKIYWNTHNIILPKFSQDQLKCGIPESLESMKPGDLIFIDNKKTGYHHVGMYIGNQQIIHASLRMKKVVIWDLDLIFKIYDLIGVRRILK